MTLNPIAFQVIQSRLNGIVQEMQNNIFRTGYSTVVRESQDAGCVLLDTAGNVVGQHIIFPVHLTSLAEVVRTVRREFGDEIYPGDAFLTNHPYFSGVTHAMDIAIVTPAFWDGELVAFCGSIAHKTDLGGVVPGTAYSSARELFQEGIQYPLVRFERDFRIVPDIEAILRANSRTPDVILGDIRGQVGCGRLGERRLAETMRSYGRDDVLATFAMMQDVSERRLRTLLAALPDGVHEAEHQLDGDAGMFVRFQVRVEKRGESIHFDFSGCDDQVAGPLNTRPPVARGAALFAVVAMLDTTLANNGGLARAVEMTFRPGSILNPHYPSPTNSYIPSCMLVSQICIRAMGGLIPYRAADCSLTGAISIGGRRDDGSSFLDYELFGGAFGGRVGSDGPSGLGPLHINARCAPIEVIESEFPARIARWELVQDSGGPGEFRGGLGARRMWQIQCERAQITLRAAGHAVAAQPLDGGLPGRSARFVIEPGPGEREMPGLFSGVELGCGAIVMDERGGGGGLGDPHRRPFARIVDDALDGYVSVEAAVERYGADRNALEAAMAEWHDAALSAI